MNETGTTRREFAEHTDMSDRIFLAAHLHNYHGGYPLGHDFVLISTADMVREHQRKHETPEPDDVACGELDEDYPGATAIARKDALAGLADETGEKD